MRTNHRIKAPVNLTQKGSGTRSLLDRRSCVLKDFLGGLRCYLEWNNGILQTVKDVKALGLTKVLSRNRKADLGFSLLLPVVFKTKVFVSYKQTIKDDWAIVDESSFQPGSQELAFRKLRQNLYLFICKVASYFFFHSQLVFLLPAEALIRKNAFTIWKYVLISFSDLHRGMTLFAYNSLLLKECLWRN